MPEIVKGPVKGWKCFDENLQCRSFPFEVGKTHEHAGEIRLCSSGFHFHEHGENLFEYYANSLKTRVCEVIGHDVLADGDKSVCRKIEIVRELSVIEVCQLRFGNGCGYGYGCGSGDGYGCGSGSGKYGPIPDFIIFEEKAA